MNGIKIVDFKNRPSLLSVENRLKTTPYENSMELRQARKEWIDGMYSPWQSYSYAEERK